MNKHKFINVKPINGHENYFICDDGSVLSLRGKKPKLLKGRLTSKKYLLVTLMKDDGSSSYLIHRLVAKHFISNLNNYPQVDHIDQNKINNNVNNLRWATNQMNHYNTKAAGVSFCNKREKHFAQIMIDGKNKFLGYFNSFETAQKMYHLKKKEIMNDLFSKNGGDE